MMALLFFTLAILVSPFKSKRRLAAENAALRQQLTVLRRQVRGRVRLINNDRLFFVQLYRWFPSVLNVALRSHSQRWPNTWSSGMARQVICAGSCKPMLAITTTSERTGRWKKDAPAFRP